MAIVCRQTPPPLEVTSQSRIVPSSLPLASSALSALNTTQRTQLVCPRKV
jgi:hypothetical protein